MEVVKRTVSCAKTGERMDVDDPYTQYSIKKFGKPMSRRASKLWNWEPEKKEVVEELQDIPEVSSTEVDDEPKSPLKKEDSKDLSDKEE